MEPGEILTLPKFAQAMGVPYRVARRWIAEGMPVLTMYEGQRLRIFLPAAREWIAAKCRALQTAGVELPRIVHPPRAAEASPSAPPQHPRAAAGPTPQGYTTGHSGRLILDNLDGAACPHCGAAIVPRSGRFGLFGSCSTFPRCRFNARLAGEAIQQARARLAAEQLSDAQPSTPATNTPASSPPASMTEIHAPAASGPPRRPPAVERMLRRLKAVHEPSETRTRRRAAR